MNYIKAYQPPHNLSARFTLYSQSPNSDGTTSLVTKNCPFSFRNFPNITQEQLLSELEPLLNSVARELHHITGFGIDKVDIRKGSTTIHKILYPNIKPRTEKNIWYSWAIRLKFSVFASRWVKQGRINEALNETSIHDGWERQDVLVGRSFFKLPVCQKTGIFRRTHYGITYDRQDALFRQFLTRFQPDGHLTFGKAGYWGSLSMVSYDYWPPAKNPTKFFKKPPRKSRLASQPFDTTDYVYLIKIHRQNIFKIGKSNDPTSRLDNLQTASPYKLKIAHTFPADNASAAEETLHELFHSTRMEGEWFKLSTGQKNHLLKIERYQDRQFWINGRGYSPDEMLKG